MNDYLAIAVAFVYVFAALGLAEALRKLLKLPVEFTRKVVHIAVGMWAWGTIALFDSKWLAIVTPAVFVVLNYVSYKRGLFLAMESNNRSNLGTVYFPIAFVAIILLLWDVDRFAVALTLMPMTWGDAFAAIIGRRFGSSTYTLAGGTRSVEGSAAMFIFTFFAVLIPWVIHGSPSVTSALTIAALSTIVEACSPNGLDNLFVPAASVAGWWLARFALGSV
jgi:phytol kinase